jgi:hypothetical protein
MKRASLPASSSRKDVCVDGVFTRKLCMGALHGSFAWEFYMEVYQMEVYQ